MQPGPRASPSGLRPGRSDASWQGSRPRPYPGGLLHQGKQAGLGETTFRDPVISVRLPQQYNPADLDSVSAAVGTQPILMNKRMDNECALKVAC